MDQVYKIKKSLKTPMLLAVVISLPVFVDVLSSGFPTKTLVIAITLMVLFYLFTLNNLIKRVIVSSAEVSIKGLFGPSRIAVGEISRLDGITMGSRQFISISTKKRNYLIPNSFDDFPGIIDALCALVPKEAIGEDLVRLRGNVVNRRSDVTMGWITVILLAIIVFIRFFPR